MSDCLIASVLGNWENWWTYDGISGPAYWGLINPAWTMCNKVGKVASWKFSCISVFQEQLQGCIAVYWC